MWMSQREGKVWDCADDARPDCISFSHWHQEGSSPVAQSLSSVYVSEISAFQFVKTGLLVSN